MYFFFGEIKFPLIRREIICTHVVKGGDFPGALNIFCILKIDHASSPVEKSTAKLKDGVMNIEE